MPPDPLAHDVEQNDPLAQAIERLLKAGVGITAVAIDATDTAADLTLAQWRALVIVTEGHGVRVGKLAKRLGVAVPSASRLVRRMEDRGLLTAKRDHEDRRATVVRSTPAGNRVLRAVLGRRRALIDQALRDAPAITSGDRVAVVDAIGRALSHFA
jgi:DNA-binding MarR family transcriptional regulator